MKIIIFILIIFAFVTSNLKSQFYDDYVCLTDENIVPEILGIPTNTSDEESFLRILIIYVTFNDDNVPGSIEPYENIWLRPDTVEGGTRPINPYTDDGTLIDEKKESNTILFMERYRQYTYSDWFCQMSGGQLDVIGDEVYFRLPFPSTHYQNTLGWRRSELNKWILRHVHNELNVDFSRYDNWTKTQNGWEWGSDGTVEMVVIQFRRIPTPYEQYYWNISGGVGGEASLGFESDTTLNLGGTFVKRGNGVTATQGINRTTRLMVVVKHEISHHIFGGYFNHAGMNSWHVSMGFMNPGHGGSTYTMTPMERSMPGLDWSIPTELTSQNAPSGSITLGDFISTGECLKIAIPNTNPQEYFWVSNHQKISPYDGVSRGSNECWLINKYEQDPYCGVGKGLFIFRESDRLCNNSQNGAFYFAFDLINADGRHNWELDRVVNDPFLGPFGIQKTMEGNRNWGVSEFNKHFLHSAWSAQLITDDPCSSNPNDYFITGDFHGDGKDAYNIGYNEILSPYSNPASNSCQSPNTNTGVTIKLLSQNQTTGAITLKVYFDDETALNELPPSKPMNVKVIQEPIDPHVGSFHPKITWDENIEPDFVESGEGDPRYAIYRGISTVCENEPTYTFLAYSYTNEYIDENTILYGRQYGSGICTYQFRAYSYKISSIDNTELESLKSEKGMITGYIDPCAPQWMPHPGTVIEEGTPETFALKQNFPNPFNPTTNIQFDLPRDEFVTIKIYDMSGRELEVLFNDFRTACRYIVGFNASHLASGVYFYSIKAGSFEQTRRMILLK